MINFPRPWDIAPDRALPYRPRSPWHSSPPSPRDPPWIGADATDGWAPAPGTSERILPSGWRTNGDEVAAFEREFAAFIGAAEAVAVSSGAAAVELSLRALHLPHGSRVAVSTMAPCSVVQAVLRVSLQPVLVDVSPETGTPTTDQLQQANHLGAPPLRAVVVTHWAGDPSDVDSLAESVGVPAVAVVEDFGPSLGARFDGRRGGGCGSACFSFYTTANLSIGDGGMIATDDSDRASRLRHSREHGTSPAARRHVRSGHVAPHVLREGGLQSSLSEQSAATGRGQLQHVNGRQLRRQVLAQRYDERLVDIPDVALPHRPASDAGEHAWQLYPMQVQRPTSERDAVVHALGLAGVGTPAPVVPLHRLAFCREQCELASTELTGADELVGQLVALPIHPSLTGTVVDRVGEVLEMVLGRRTAS